MKNDIIKTPEEGRALYDELLAKSGDEQAALEIVAQKLGETPLVASYYIGLKSQTGQLVAKGPSKKQNSVFLVVNSPEDQAVLQYCEDEIIRNYQIVKDAVAAWIRLGFAMARAKSIIKHGCFLKWRLAVFPDLGGTHLTSAQRVAEKILASSNLSAEELNYTGEWENTIRKAIEIYGFTSQNQLFIATKENRPLSLAEEEHKKWVLDKFEERPDWADEYMPLIETGERTWTQVMMALMGREKAVDEDGNRRQTEPYLAFYRHVQTLPGSAKTLGSWEKIPADVQGKIIDSIRETIKFIPPGARHLLLPNDVVDVEATVTAKN